jgi:hypothetical protein
MNRLRKKIRRITPFTTVFKKKKKPLGINLTEEVKDLYNEKL